MLQRRNLEILSHAYSHLYDLPITAFRFFTVYGLMDGLIWPPINLSQFCLGNPSTFSIMGKWSEILLLLMILLKQCITMPCKPDCAKNKNITNDSISPVGPWRVINIGNSKPIKLLDFISTIETCTGISAKKNFMPMQAGDVVATWADTELLYNLTGYSPNTELHFGISQFISWFRSYYGNKYK